MTSVIPRKQIWLLSAVVTCLLILPIVSNAATYYVGAANGNDANVGTAREAPLKTINKASQKALAGDTVLVLPGTYDERVYVRRSGASGQPIIYQAEGTVVCRGFTVQASYIHIVGFEITDTVNNWEDGDGVHSAGKYNEIRSNYIHDVTRIGIQIFSPSPDSPEGSNCVVRGNRIVRAGLAGIEIYGQNHLIESNEISHTLQYPVKWTNPPDWADADGLHFFGSGHIIRKNFIHDITLKDPENINPHIDCFQTYGPAYNIVFEQNFCDIPDDNMQGYMIELINAPVQDITVRNSVIKAFRPLNVWNCPGTVIVNNTFASKLSYQGPSGYGIELHSSPNSKVKNNLFYDVGRHTYQYAHIDSTSQTGTDVGYNSHFISDGKPPAGSPRANDLWQVDPKLVDVAANDFRLTAGSPLIDAGATLAEVTVDFDGLARPQGSGYDIGAFEFGSPAGLYPPSNLRIVQ